VPEARFVFMGGEPAEIDALRSRAPANCVFAGKRPVSELPAFLGLADLLASPRTRGVNLPFKVYTYLASGKPLVATRIESHTQLLDDRLAFLVDPTPAGLAAGVRSALQDPDEARLRAARGRELIERDFSARRFVEKVREAYGAIESSSSARAASRS
jgi:glycosyltransferase involved in cell wall biosynthesis